MCYRIVRLRPDIPVLLCLALVVLGLISCQGRAPEGTQSAAQDTAGMAPPGSLAGPPVPAPDTSRASEQPPAAGQPAAAIALSGEGLRIVNRQTGVTRALEFGMDEDQTITTVTAVQGDPRTRAVNPECGAAAFAAWGNGLTLWFQESRFAGWSVNRPPRGAIPEDMRRLTTMSGAGIGSTRSEIESAYVMTVTQTTLGAEFEAGGLQGLLTSAAGDAEVTDLWSGMVCIFR